MSEHEISETSVKLTPMMEQWVSAKQEYPDAIVLFRMGDFYELFGEDAQLAAPILELALTSRDKDKSGFKMAGFPIHAAEAYVAKLIGIGHKVAMCDQLEDPKLKKGIVKRGITQVITPGTLIEAEAQSHENAYLLSVLVHEGIFALAALDLGSSTFIMTSSSERDKLLDELARLKPKELVLLRQDKAAITLVDDFMQRLGPSASLRIEKREAPLATWQASVTLSAEERAASLICAYIAELKGNIPAHVASPARYSIDAQLLMDQSTRDNLDLLPRKKGEQYNLFGIMQECKTAMGRRALSKAIMAPSTCEQELRKRHDLVGELLSHTKLLYELRQQLNAIYDLEKLTALAAANKIGPRYLARLRDCLQGAMAIKTLIAGQDLKETGAIVNALPNMDEFRGELARALIDCPPMSVKDGGIFCAAYDAELDELMELTTNGHQLLLSLELRERELTGIASLKIKYTRVFGYYIEVTKSNIERVPSRYQRKQTIANGERYITEELSELEVKLNTAHDQISRREQQLFEKLRKSAVDNAPSLVEISRNIAVLDMLSCFAELARSHNWVRPTILAKERCLVDIKSGRHPIVEERCLHKGSFFVPNDVRLDGENCSIALVTGPNMAGKSTIMRQVALIQIMAQMGSYVPAAEATLSLCDSIFARVGASDDLSMGRSTFMVEMTETAHILQNASAHSLIVLDEIGRGTSTYDGMSIAQAVAEYIHDELRSRTLFATHYHELTELEKHLKLLKNFHVEVEEKDDSVIFLYSLRSGPAAESFGIQVAKLAGLPATVVQRARQVLCGLEKNPAPHPHQELVQKVQPDFFALASTTSEKNSITEQIAKLDINKITPLQALNKVQGWQNSIRIDRRNKSQLLT